MLNGSLRFHVVQKPVARGDGGTIKRNTNINKNIILGPAERFRYDFSSPRRLYCTFLHLLLLALQMLIFLRKVVKTYESTKCGFKVKSKLKRTVFKTHNRKV